MVIVSPGDRCLNRHVQHVAELNDVPFRALQLQALMHLPRIADSTGCVRSSDAAREIKRVSAWVPKNAEWFVDQNSRTTVKTRDLRMERVPEEMAADILMRFHYLRSFRARSFHFGAWFPDNFDTPLALVSLSENDVEALRLLSERLGVEPDRSCIVSRVFAFPGSPKNTISWLLGRVRALSLSQGRKILFTYVNPNLGFHGSSYKAAGWSLLSRESVSAYRYLDCRYVTDRYLMGNFGTDDEAELALQLEGRFDTSVMSLSPLHVYGRNVESRRRSGSLRFSSE